MTGSNRNVLGTGLAMLTALGLGFIGGQSVGSAPVDAGIAQDPRSCQEAVERLASIEGRLAASGHERGTASPSAILEVPSGESGAIVAKLDSLRGRVEELMARPVCETAAMDPQAAEEKNLAKLEDPENREAFGDARSVVDYAIRDGRWTRDDADSLRELLPRLTWKQQEDILGVLLPELNASLEVDFFPPF